VTRSHKFIIVLTAAVLYGGSACSGDDSSNGTTVQATQEAAPSMADVTRDAGLVFPPSVSDFRLVNISETQIDLSFQIDADEVATFAEESGLTLTRGERAIKHASPIWQLEVYGEFSGSVTAFGKVQRAVEVVANEAFVAPSTTAGPTTTRADSDAPTNEMPEIARDPGRYTVRATLTLG